VAAVVFPAIIVMHETAGTFFLGAAGHRQSGRLIGQETGTPELL